MKTPFVSIGISAALCLLAIPPHVTSYHQTILFFFSFIEKKKNVINPCRKGWWMTPDRTTGNFASLVSATTTHADSFFYRSIAWFAV